MYWVYLEERLTVIEARMVWVVETASFCPWVGNPAVAVVIGEPAAADVKSCHPRA